MQLFISSLLEQLTKHFVIVFWKLWVALTNVYVGNELTAGREIYVLARYFIRKFIAKRW